MTNLSPSHLILVNAEQQYLLALWQYILACLENGTDFHFTAEEKNYWLDRGEQLAAIIESNANMLKIGTELLERREKINALVPFVNKAHLN
jgi:hypothetical protein